MKHFESVQRPSVAQHPAHACEKPIAFATALVAHVFLSAETTHEMSAP